MTEQMKNAITAFTTELEKSEELAAYRAAKAKYDADSELKALINEYNVQAAVLEQEGKKSEAERDKTLIDSVSARLRAVYDEIGRSETLAEMRAAEEVISELAGELNSASGLTIDPDSANCTHDCSTCGGCH